MKRTADPFPVPVAISPSGVHPSTPALSPPSLRHTSSEPSESNLPQSSRPSPLKSKNRTAEESPVPCATCPSGVQPPPPATSPPLLSHTFSEPSELKTP